MPSAPQRGPNDDDLPDASIVPFDGLSAEQQQWIADLLDQHLIAVESGLPSPIEQRIAEHPELESPLRQYLQGLDLVSGNLASDNRASSSSGIPNEPTSTARLSDFVLGDELGRGAMGIVYSAVKISTGQPVAIKILSLGATLHDGLVARFMREARAAQSLAHPNIVPVYDIGAMDGAYFYTMQPINGRSLDQHVADARLSRRRGDTQAMLLRGDDRFARLALRFAEIADALHAAHQHGIVHRDVKPSNLLVDSQDEKLWLTDFGLVRISQEQGLTRTGDLIGTYRYMSPEQARGRVDLVGPQTDIYGLGATLYEALALRPVFRGEDSARLLQRIDVANAQPLRHWDKQIPRDLETITMRAIHPEIASRYGASDQFADDLRRFAQGRPILARRKRWYQPARRFDGRRPTLAVPIAIGLLVLTTIGLASAWRRIASSGTVGPSVAQRPQTGDRQQMRSELLSLAIAERLTQAQQDQCDRIIAGLSQSGPQSDIQRLRCAALSIRINDALQRRESDGQRWDVASADLDQSLAIVSQLPSTHANADLRALVTINRLRWSLAEHNKPTENEDVNEGRNDHPWTDDDHKALAQALGQMPAPQSMSRLMRVMMTRSMYWLSMQLKQRGQISDALQIAEPMLAICQVDADQPDANLNSQQQATAARCHLASLYFDSNRWDQSIAMYQDAIAGQQHLIEAFPWNRALRSQRAATLCNLGRAQVAAARPERARESYQTAIDQLDALTHADPEQDVFWYQSAIAHLNLSVLLREMGQSQAANDQLRQAEYRQSEAIRLAPHNARYQNALAAMKRHQSTQPAEVEPQP